MYPSARLCAVTISSTTWYSWCGNPRGSRHSRASITPSFSITRTFNVSEIVHSQIPDVDGNLVPLTVHEGSAEISGSRGETEQIMVGIAAGTYNVQKATCGNPCNTCNGIAETELELETFGVTVGGSTTESLIATFNTGSKQDYSPRPHGPATIQAS